MWVGGKPGETAGPVLRGAAMRRTLQEGPKVCGGLAVSPGKNRGSHTARSGHAPHTPGGTNYGCGIVKPRFNFGSHTARSGQAPHTQGAAKPLFKGQVWVCQGVCMMIRTRPSSTTLTLSSRSPVTHKTAGSTVS